jgi:hypothetical protein
MQRALAVLSEHHADWPAELDIPARLSRRVVAQSRVLGKNLADLEGNDLTVYWVADARNLALTRDPQVVPLLRPFLDCRKRVVDLSLWSAPLTYPGPALRVCDVALEAILTLRGEDLPTAYARAQPTTGPATQPSYRAREAFAQAMDTVRDGLIQDVKRRLP